MAEQDRLGQVTLSDSEMAGLQSFKTHLPEGDMGADTTIPEQFLTTSELKDQVELGVLDSSLFDPAIVSQALSEGYLGIVRRVNGKVAAVREHPGDDDQVDNYLAFKRMKDERNRQALSQGNFRVDDSDGEID